MYALKVKVKYMTKTYFSIKHFFKNNYKCNQRASIPQKPPEVFIYDLQYKINFEHQKYLESNCLTAIPFMIFLYMVYPANAFKIENSQTCFITFKKPFLFQIWNIYCIYVHNKYISRMKSNILKPILQIIIFLILSRKQLDFNRYLDNLLIFSTIHNFTTNFIK